MWPSDDARSDFVLAAGTVLLAPHVLVLLTEVLSLFGARLGTTSLVILFIVFAFVATGLVPLLLARHRGEGIGAFGLDQPRGGAVVGLLLAAPVVVLTLLLALERGQRDVLDSALGQFGELGDTTLEMVLTLLAMASSFAGMVLLYTFLTVKARDGFRRTELPQLSALRTFGMGAAAAAFVMSLLLAITPTFEIVPLTLEVLALVVLLLIVDRLVVAGAMTSRATVLAPAIVLLATFVSLSTRNLLVVLRNGLIAAGVVLVISVLVETRRYAWAVVTLLGALTIYGTALRPAIFTI